MPHRYLIFNKPFGVLCQFSGESDTLKNYVAIKNVYPVGRLDRDSEGLVLFTDDGELQHWLSDPKFGHPRTYWAQVEGTPEETALRRLREGITIQGYRTRPALAALLTAEPAGFDDHLRSFKTGKREHNDKISGSICDALMAQSPGELTFAINRSLIGEGVTATDEEAGRAVAFAFHELKLVVEPGGAVALAALLAGKIDVRHKVVAVVLSGGNVDPELFSRLVA